MVILVVRKLFEIGLVKARESSSSELKSELGLICIICMSFIKVDFCNNVVLNWLSYLFDRRTIFIIFVVDNVYVRSV